MPKKVVADKKQNDEELMSLYFEWSHMNTDPTQYKPYAPSLTPSHEKMKIYIEFKVPRKYVVSSTAEDGPGYIALTPEGSFYIMQQYAAKMNEWFGKK